MPATVVPVRSEPDPYWTPKRIKQLRHDLGLTQAEFGQRIWDYPEAAAQSHTSRLENGKVPSAAVRKHLQRLEQEAQEHKSTP